MDTVESKNKLVRSITPEELTAFLEELANTPGVDGPMIQAKALEKFEIKIGHESANNFRKEVFGKYIANLRNAVQFAKIVKENSDAEDGRMFSDLASNVLQQGVFEFVMTEKIDLGSKEGMERAEALSRIIKSARSEDRAMIKQQEQRIQELEAEKKHTAAGVLSAAKEAGASPAFINSVREALNFRPPAPEAVKGSSSQAVKEVRQ